jgi:hypothetical protein
VLPLGTIKATGPGGYASDPTWYGRTAGVVALSLTSAQVAAAAGAPLALSSATAETTTQITEWTSGAFVRADAFVFRVSPGDTLQVPVYASQWGRPLAGAQIGFVADPSQLQPGNYINPQDVPPVATPPGALEFNRTAVTDASGKALLALTASDPGNPRGFIDGQVYGVRPGFTDAQFTGPVNQWNFISFLLWDAFNPPQPVTWYGGVQPIFQQYANLYPVMKRFLDLANYQEVCANVRLLQLAFGLNPGDPNSMPVTRDLSPAKRNAILAFLANPLLGTPPATTGVRSAAAPAPAAAPQAARGRGGKAEAAARRVAVVRKAHSS